MHLNTIDKANIVPNKSLIGSIWMHYKNNRLYKIEEYVWNCDTDKWHVVYAPYFRSTKTDVNWGCDDNTIVRFSRSYTDFFAEVDGKKRFIKVETD